MDYASTHNIDIAYARACNGACADCGMTPDECLSNPCPYIVGQTFTYDDGREGHNVKGEVIALTSSGFIAQFADRADTTAIAWHEIEWMDYITFD